MRAVVWRTGALGDLVCTLPVLDRAREIADDLVVVAPSRYRALWDRADEWIDADGIVAARWLSGVIDADLGLAWTASTGEAMRAAGVVDVRIGSAHPPPGVHILDHLWAPVRDVLGPRERDPVVGARGAGDGPVVLAPGSGGARKRWPLARWHAVAAGLSDVLWVGGPVEASEPGWGVPRRDDLDLAGLARLAASCRCWLGPDAGPSHLARAVGAPTGVIFVEGTDPGCWAPPGARVFKGDPDPEEVLRWARPWSLQAPDPARGPG